MSWDIWLTTEVDGRTVTIEDAGDFNYTHNCNRMIRHAGFEEWPYQLDGMPAGDFCKRLDAVLVAFREDPDRYREMNPENGWGDFDSLHLLLTEVLDSFDPFPSARVGCSA